MRKFTVVIEWAGRADEFDADEIVVFADSGPAAVGKARRLWRETIGARWPHLKIVKAQAYTPRMLNDLAR